MRDELPPVPGLAERWGSPTHYLNAAYSPTEEELTSIARSGTQIDAALIARIGGVADVVLQDGRTLRMNGLFTQPNTLLASPIAEQLGCALEDGPMGRFIQVDEGKATSVPNVFAYGDAARAAGNVTLAMADGGWRMGRWRGLGRIGALSFEGRLPTAKTDMKFENVSRVSVAIFR